MESQEPDLPRDKLAALPSLPSIQATIDCSPTPPPNLSRRGRLNISLRDTVEFLGGAKDL